jgi:uncharacterized membrane protein YhhN
MFQGAPLAGIFMVLAIFIAGLDWVAVGFNLRRVQWFAKPATMVFLLGSLCLVIFSHQSPGVVPLWQSPLAWFVLAAFFSLLGDIFLMLSAGLFLAGLGAFLVAHLAYIAGLNTSLPPLLPLGIGLAAMSGVVAAVMKRVQPGLANQTGGRRLAPAVLTYSLILSAMMLSAVLTLFRPEWDKPDAVLVAIGGILFLCSDTLLGWDRFVGPVRHGRLGVMVTYHLAQFALAGGALLHFAFMP